MNTNPRILVPGVCRASRVKPEKSPARAIFYPANCVSTPDNRDFLRHQAQKIHKCNRLLAALICALVVVLAACQDPNGRFSPEEEAAAFKTAHGAVLAKTTAAIAIADETAVDAALAAYNALGGPAKALLNAEKTLLDSLKAKIATLGQRLITLALPGDEANGELPDPVSISKPNGEANLTVNGDFDGYRWLVDGLIKGNGKTFTLKAADYSAGLHQISVEVTRNGAVYSESGSFTVN
jgi:hypothetical protein